MSNKEGQNVIMGTDNKITLQFLWLATFPGLVHTMANFEEHALHVTVYFAISFQIDQMLVT